MMRDKQRDRGGKSGKVVRALGDCWGRGVSLSVAGVLTCSSGDIAPSRPPSVRLVSGGWCNYQDRVFHRNPSLSNDSHLLLEMTLRLRTDEDTRKPPGQDFVLNWNLWFSLWTSVSGIFTSSVKLLVRLIFLLTTWSNVQTQPPASFTFLPGRLTASFPPPGKHGDRLPPPSLVPDLVFKSQNSLLTSIRLINLSCEFRVWHTFHEFKGGGPKVDYN